MNSVYNLQEGLLPPPALLSAVVCPMGKKEITKKEQAAAADPHSIDDTS
jgi:hypothetical protein